MNDVEPGSALSGHIDRDPSRLGHFSLPKRLLQRVGSWVVRQLSGTKVPDATSGFRALSANIAVELPEAPEGGTLFRVLFLAAFLLFCLTFVVNTLAELVRLRLRRRYRYL